MKPGLVYTFGVPVYFFSLLLLIIAIFYAIVWPKQIVNAKPRQPLERFILRWGHSISWLFLAVALIAWGLRNIPIAALLAILGGLSYLIYVVLLVGGVRRRDKKIE
jgi:hypothetical protein